MADGVVSFLLEKLSTLLSQKYTQLEGIEKDIQYIRDELESLSGFLRNAERKQDYGLLDAEQQAWIKQLIEAAYDMEDTVDYFSLCFANNNHIHPGFCTKVGRMYNSVKNLRARHRISLQIKDTKERVEHIAARHHRYRELSLSNNEGITPETTTTTSSVSYQQQHPIRGHALLLTEADLVGIDEPKHEIISMILNDDDNSNIMKAIAVVGMGGLGKTTLVKRVYEDVKISFSIHAWLTLSQTIRIEATLKDLIRKISIPVPPGEVVDSMDADALRQLIRDFLKEKRYIIVLDDLWKIDHWDSFKYIFPRDNNRGSCIIITTRNVDVATACCRQFRNGNVYKMMPLSIDESWNLFTKTTFGNDMTCPQHLKNIANIIITKCGGLPLGIVAIGGLLALKDTTQVGEWNMVLRSLGSELEGSGKLTPITKILFLSYNELPYYLKSCLLYMGIFSEDEIVDVEELKFLWIAEGFVNARLEMTAMEVAKSYLDELIRRSLIQVAETELDGRLSKCRVHDLIYEIILTKCKEHNILTSSLTPHTAWPKNVRRLRVNDPACVNKHFKMLHLRSLFVNIHLHSDYSLSILLNGVPKLLKVLDLPYTYTSTIPDGVFKLSNLKYLNLTNTKVTNIPKSIRNLQNLEYLNLNLGYSPVQELPEEILKLKKLYYLNTGFMFIKVPDKLADHLSCLQYLARIEVDREEVMQEIGKLIQLRELHIKVTFTRRDNNGRNFSLEKLTNLRRLLIYVNKRNVIFDVQCLFTSPLQFLFYLDLGVPLVKVPDWVTSCHDLSTLYMSKSDLREDPLESLAGLPNLVDFRLLNDSYMGKSLHFKAGGFQKLKRLDLEGLHALELVIFEKQTLSNLETFNISHCHLLEELPVGMQYLKKLRSLMLYDTSSWLQNKMRSKKRDRDGSLEVAHITKILIVEYINGERRWELQ